MKNLFYALLLLTTVMQAQNTPSMLDGRQYGVILESPGTKNVVVKPDVTYLKDAKGALHLDIYLPPGLKKSEQRPVIVFLNALGDREGESKLKSWEIYTSWPRLVAANGYIGISMETDPERVQESLQGIFEFLIKNAAACQIDPERIGVYAASGNVGQAVAYLMGDKVCKGIRAAVLYYGYHQAGPYRRDLPVFSVIAEGDVRRNPGSVDNLWKDVLANNAPWTIKMASGMPHAFDSFADNEEGRRIILETLSFWKNHLDPVPAPSRKPQEGRDLLGALGMDRAKALVMLQEMVKKYPDDQNVLSLYGNELAFAGQLETAEATYLRVLNKDPNDFHTLVSLIGVLYRQKKTEAAEKRLTEALNSGKMDANAYAQLGFNLLVLGEDQEAARCYEKALAMRPQGLDYYNLGCAYSKSNNPDKAFTALGKAIEHGYHARTQFENDPDLAPLKSDGRFQELLMKTH